MLWYRELLLVVAFVVIVGGDPLARSSRDRNDRRYRVVCVHVAWSFYRPGNGQFGVDQIDPQLCTHLIYGYAGLHNNRIRSLDGYLDLEGDYGRGNYKKFNELREQNPHLTTLLSVGGKTEGSIKFSEMAKSSEKRKEFVQSCLNMIEENNFDGLNLDWQFPAQKGGVPEDKQRFTRLLQDLRDAFSEKGFVLTATVGSQKETIDDSYEVDKISNIVDFLNVNAYDYRRGGDKLTGFSSPLYPKESGNNFDKMNNADFTMSYWIEKGAAADKLILGASACGQSWTLSSPRANVLVQNSSGPGESWPYSREAGTFGYNELCEVLKDGEWSVNWENVQKTSFATSADQWITYDDSRSVTEKAIYAKSKKLGGVLIQGIESDDFRGLCSGLKFPLLNGVNEILNDGERPATTTTSTPTTTPELVTTSTTTTRPPIDFVCPHVGFFRHPTDCTRYFQCIRTGWAGAYTTIEFLCGAGTVFDQKHTVCTWKHLVPECA